MRNYLVNAPWWMLSLLTGVPFGVFMWLLPPGINWIIGGICGALFGAIMGPFFALLRWSQLRRLRSAVGPVPPEAYPLIHRALWRGPIPADPEIRKLAYHLAVHYLDETIRKRVSGLLVFGAILIGAVSEAVFMSSEAPATSAWVWLIAVSPAVLVVLWLFQPALLRRRIELLRPDEDTPPPESAGTPPA